jgi:hypothetical protein
MAGKDPQTQRPTRIVASLLISEGTTWFFKMIGPDALVSKEKPAFKELLKSIQFHPSGGQEQPVQMARAERPMSTNAKQAPGGASGDRPVWEVPAGWQEQPPTAMRLASFLVTGANGEKADISVTRLMSAGGGLLPNVNRWRGQVGLPPVDEAGLEKLITTQELAGMKIMVVDLAGRSVESGQQARLVAAIVPRSGATWFYKMFGDDQFVAQQKSAFTKFVESARYPNAS